LVRISGAEPTRLMRMCEGALNSKGISVMAAITRVM